jgi:hypothetical protein
VFTLHPAVCHGPFFDFIVTIAGQVFGPHDFTLSYGPSKFFDHGLKWSGMYCYQCGSFETYIGDPIGPSP